MPEGDVGLYREASGGTTVTSAGVDLSFDTVDQEHRSTFSYSSGIISVKEACRVMYFAGADLAKTTSGAETGALRLVHDPNNSGSYVAEHGAWDMGYFSDVNGVENMPLGIGGVVDCTAQSRLKLTAASEGNDLSEAAARSFLHLYRLPASAKVLLSTRNTNQTSISTTYVDVAWNNDLLLENWSSSSGTFTWNGGTSRHLVFVCLTLNLTTNQDRCTVGMRLMKNGTAVPFGLVRKFIRGTGGDQFVTMRLVLPIDLVNGDALKVQTQVVVRANALSQPRVQQNRSAIAAIELPTGINFFFGRDSANQDADISSLTDFALDTADDLDPSFTHSDPSITLKRGRKYVLGYGLKIDRTSSSTADDIAWDVAWRKNSTSDLDTRGSSGFTEGSVSSQDFMETCLMGGCIVQAVVDDVYKLRTTKIGTGADSSADYVSGVGGGGSFVWAFDLDDLTPLNLAVVGEATTQPTTYVKVPREGRVLGEAQADPRVVRKQLTESRVLGEGSVSAEQVRKQLTESRVLGEGSASAEPVRKQLLELATLGEPLSKLELTVEALVELLLETRALGEGQAAVALGLVRQVETRALGEVQAWVELARLLCLEVKSLGEGQLDGRAILKLLVEQRVLGESTNQAEVWALRLLEARGVGEGQQSTALTRGQVIEGRILGEGQVDARSVLGRMLEARAAGEGFVDPRLVLRQLLEARLVGEGQSDARAALLRLLEANGLGESQGAAEPTRKQLLESATAGESYVDPRVTLRQLVEARALGESGPATEVARRQLLEARGLGEPFWKTEVDFYIASELLLESRVLGEGQATALVGLARQVESRTIGEGQAWLALGRMLGLQAPALGEGLTTGQQMLKRILESRSLGEAWTEAQLQRQQLLEARGLGEGPTSTQSTLLRALEVRALGEALSSYQPARLQLLELAALGEGAITVGLGSIAQLLMESRVWGEGLATLALGMRYGVEARAMCEAESSLLVGLIRVLEVRVFGEHHAEVQAVRQRQTEGRSLGEAMAAVELSRLQLLESRAFGEAAASSALGLRLGVEARGTAEGFAPLQLACTRFLEARTYGEAALTLLVIESITNRYRINIVVKRPRVGVTVIETTDGIEVARSGINLEVR